jgi:hypothetical protein
MAFNYEAVVTPVGVAVFPWLTKPDTMHDPEGVYKVDLSVPEEDAQDLIAKLERVRDTFIASLPHHKAQALTPRPVYLIEYTRPEIPADATDTQKKALWDSHVPEPTGNVLFRWKLKAHVTPKEGEAFDQKPVVVMNDTGEKVESPVYAGSTLRIKGQVVPYTNAASGMVGVTLRMRAVRVYDLVTSGGGEASDNFWVDMDGE